MRCLRLVLTLTSSCAVLAGCAYLPSRAALTLSDCHDPGHRIVLRRNGTYIQSTYMDRRHSGYNKRRGSYTLDGGGTHLALSRAHDRVDHLYRVDHAGEQYWVEEKDRPRITAPADNLRSESFRTVAE